MPVAALVVHQLRYTLAFGGHAGIELSRQGHAYLHSLVPWIVLLIGVAVGVFLWSLGRALGGQRTLSRYTLSLAGLWIVCSGCLLAIYVAQELLEGLWATGHPLGLAGIFGYGGWWAVQAALCIGLVLATIFHGARWVLDEVANAGVLRRTTLSRDATLRPAGATPCFHASRRWPRAGRAADLPC